MQKQEMSNLVGENSQYDKIAKKILSYKRVLANILIRTISYFKGKTVDEVSDLIENVECDRVPVDSGMTNKVGEDRIVGMNTEDSEVNEGLIRYDIIFKVKLPDRVIKIIVNLEAQKTDPTKYNIMNRAIFYVSRLISSQKEREFIHSDYNSMLEVYSIWICMNKKQNSLIHYGLEKHTILGDEDWAGNINIPNIVMIGLSNEIPEKGSELELHRMLAAMFAESIESEVRCDILQEEYDLGIDSQFRKELNDMSSLSMGIFEQGMEKGVEKGFEQGMEQGIEKGAERKQCEMILNSYEEGLPISLIAKITGLSEEKVLQIIEENKDTEVKKMTVF